MKKIIILCLVLSALFGALTIASVIVNQTMNVKRNFAYDHYRASYVERYVTSKGYGCGEMDCKYCSGLKLQSTYWDFAYYKTVKKYEYTTGKMIIAFGVVTGVFLLGGLAAAGVVFFKKTKKP